MSLSTPTAYWPLRSTPQSFSELRVGLIVLATSFASQWFFRRYEPRSSLSRVALLVVIPALLSFPISYTHAVSWYAALPLAFIAYGGSLGAFILAYRLSPFHPLAKFPGPLIAKTSKLWAAYVSFRGDQHRYYKRLHDLYGDVVPTSSLFVMLPLFTPYLAKGAFLKDHAGIGGLVPPALIAQRDPVKHAHQRKPWNRALSSVALKEYEAIVAKRTRQLASCLENLVHRSGHKDGTALDMAAWFSYFATDFMGDMAFGGGFELMNAGGDKDGIWTFLESGLRIGVAVGHVSYFTPFLSALTGQKGSIQVSRDFGRESVFKRLQAGANRKDLFYHLSGEELPESERPSVVDVAQDGLLAIIAGSDTTSSSLTGTIYYLLLNPTAYDRLQKEVDSAFPNGEEPLDVVKLSQMEWLNGCINETLRLLPAVPSGSQRSVLKGKGTKVLGRLYVGTTVYAIARFSLTIFGVHTRRVLPEETQLFLHTYSIHRDERNFHNPEAFLPERWFSKGAPAGEHNATAFIPFSYGPTICAGKNLALMEMRMVLCWLLQRFRFSKVPGVAYEEWEGKIQDWFVTHVEPLSVNVSIRV
ncbi:high nitrogen upregulated cytochrome P450 monooxygenase 2 [Russula earlei]|uniref:High nitrogen upregulated cytochrome P450 monooxygenase 2 n=1 Tax=Russula earlei TaxID=71964 RepID=A0ACC0U587_9AGAM|nr:high nitrogen upregulated cytochrome P450 monooxygenase 2 [Russula earlei]